MSAAKISQLARSQLERSVPNRPFEIYETFIICVKMQKQNIKFLGKHLTELKNSVIRISVIQFFLKETIIITLNITPGRFKLNLLLLN